MARSIDPFIFGVLLVLQVSGMCAAQQRFMQQQRSAVPQPRGRVAAPQTGTFTPTQMAQRNQQPLQQQMQQDQQLANMVSGSRSLPQADARFSPINFPTLQMNPGVGPEISISPVIPQLQPLQMQPLMQPNLQQRMMAPPQRPFYPPAGMSGGGAFDRAYDPSYGQGNQMGGGNMYGQGANIGGQSGAYDPYGPGSLSSNYNPYGQGSLGGMYGGAGNMMGGSYGNNMGNQGVGNMYYGGNVGGIWNGGTASQQVECACTEEYLPVCGSDGISYINLCKLRCANLNNPAVQAISKGDCSQNSQPDVVWPASGYGTGSTCEWQCSRGGSNVCDSNGQRYLNQCVFYKNVCRAVVSGTVTVPVVATCPISSGLIIDVNSGTALSGTRPPVIVRDVTPGTVTTSRSTAVHESSTATAITPTTPRAEEVKTTESSGIVLRSLDAFDPYHSVALTADSINSDPLVVRDLSDR